MTIQMSPMWKTWQCWKPGLKTSLEISWRTFWLETVLPERSTSSLFLEPFSLFGTLHSKTHRWNLLLEPSSRALYRDLHLQPFTGTFIFIGKFCLEPVSGTFEPPCETGTCMRNLYVILCGPKQFISWPKTHFQWVLSLLRRVLDHIVSFSWTFLWNLLLAEPWSNKLFVIFGQGKLTSAIPIPVCSTTISKTCRDAALKGSHIWQSDAKCSDLRPPCADLRGPGIQR